MDEKIDLGLFARLMRLSAPRRKDLLEYIGQGPVPRESVRHVVNGGIVPATIEAAPAMPAGRGAKQA